MCPFCEAAKSLLKSKNLKFEFINLDSDQSLREKLSKELNHYTVPMIFIDDKFIGGFSELQNIQSSL